jgi:hypothetical protein
MRQWQWRRKSDCGGSENEGENGGKNLIARDSGKSKSKNSIPMVVVTFWHNNIK